MDDLKMIGALLAKPGPPEDVVERGARQLENAIHAPARHRWNGWEGMIGRLARPRARWLAAGAGISVAAAVAITAVAVPSGTSGGAAHLTGRQILLTAARAAEAQPVTSGRYWHVKMAWQTGPGFMSGALGLAGGSSGLAGASSESWADRGGQVWVSGQHGTAIKVAHPAHGFVFQVGGITLSYAGLQNLPTTPAALRTWMVNAVKAENSVPPASAAASARFNSLVANLVSLLSVYPAPPAVRAATFRVLAALPGVRSLGRADGGVAVLIESPPGGEKVIEKLVIDPATAQLRRAVEYGRVAGALRPVLTTHYLIDQWTNQLPKVVPAPGKHGNTSH
jgi:hypothetical protein